MKVRCKCGTIGFVSTKCRKCSNVIPTPKPEPILEVYNDDDGEEVWELEDEEVNDDRK